MDELDIKAQKLTQLVLPHVAPLFLLPHKDAGPQDVLNNGSAALVDTGTKTLLVTCHHVWDEFTTYVHTHPEAIIVMGLGNARPGMNVTSFPLIDTVASIDVATVDFPSPGLLHQTGKKFAVSPSWPPLRPEKDEIIVTSGWPGINRRLTADGKDLLFRSTTFIDFVVSVSDRHLVLADINNQRRVTTYQDDVHANTPHGGMSGCPAFVNRHEALEFIGIVYEAGEGRDAIVFIAHAGYIKGDGMIDRLALPS